LSSPPLLPPFWCIRKFFEDSPTLVPCVARNLLTRTLSFFYHPPSLTRMSCFFGFSGEFIVPRLLCGTAEGAVFPLVSNVSPYSCPVTNFFVGVFQFQISASLPSLTESWKAALPPTACPCLGFTAFLPSQRCSRMRHSVLVL